MQFVVAATLACAGTKLPGERPVRFIEQHVEREVPAERVVEGQIAPAEFHVGDFARDHHVLARDDVAPLVLDLDFRGRGAAQQFAAEDGGF